MQLISVAFSGTRHGMTVGQASTIHKALTALMHDHSLVVRHGMCIGSDEQFHEIAEGLGIPIVGHPGITRAGKVYLRSGKDLQCQDIEPPQFFPIRNRTMVDRSNIVLATPQTLLTYDKTGGGGTWQVLRYARTRYKLIHIVWPNGRVSSGRGNAQILQEPM